MENEAAIRLGFFAAIFAAMAAFELASPRLLRDEMQGALKARRWFTNLGMLLVSSAIARVIFPAATVGVALWADAQGFGLFHWLRVPAWIAAMAAFILLDFAVWLEHVVSHRWAWLWRIHRVHHSDTGFDVTTALRFHPLEIIISLIWKGAVVAALGAPVIAVLVFEIVLNGMAMFNHANAAFPGRLDATLRRVLVTPDMHRIHHSQDERETNANYGFNFSFWDRLAGLHVEVARKGETGLDIGLREHEAADAARLPWALKLPFLPRSAAGGG
jgi:sterol desaturase/sphingolipid hydroxylase (fatty acid hydroxylase superfamily)